MTDHKDPKKDAKIVQDKDKTQPEQNKVSLTPLQS